MLFALSAEVHEHKHGNSCSGHGHEKETHKHEETKKHVEKDHDGHDHDKDHKDKDHGKVDEHDHDKDHKDKDHGKVDEHDHDKEHKHQGKDEEASAVVLTDAQKKLIKLELSKAVAGDLSTKIFLPGEVKYNRDRMAQIMPRMPGFVSKVLKKEGDKVNAGETLAVLQSHKLGELYAEYRSATELEVLAKTEFDIKRKLWAKKATSERDYIKARQEYAESRVARHRAEDKLKSLGLNPEADLHSDHKKDSVCTNYYMKSPINGTVISKDITIGENYSEDNTDVPFVVSDLSRLWLDLNARQSDLSRLKKGLKVIVKFGDGFPDLKGEISYIAPTFKQATRTVLVRVILDNKNGLLKPGLYATGVVSIPGKGSTVVVPRSAVQIIAGEKVIFVPDGKGFKAVPVMTGRGSGGMVEVIAGLKPGDKYVSQGGFELKAVMITSGMDPHAGHGH
jgi:cobalt-zinc-cadmium efflux system membrane fusion protein